MFECKDLAGLSQPLTKLIETIGKGCGLLYKPRAIRKEADARAYEIERLAIANAKANIVEFEVNQDIAMRASQRFYKRELNRQINLESVFDFASEELSDSVSEEQVNQDWFSRYVNYAQDISDKDMQFLWGKVLSGEVSKPGSFSLRTLEVLKNMSRAEAESFSIACSLSNHLGEIFDVGDTTDVMDYSSRLSDYGLTGVHRSNLWNSGLLFVGWQIQNFTGFKVNELGERVVIYDYNG